MRRSKLKKQIMAAFLAVAMAITSVNFVPSGAATAYAAENATLAAGDYYIMNTATGRFLNGGNSWGSQASAFNYGQLVTLIALEDGTYNIDTHIVNKDNASKHFLNDEGYMDGFATSLTIVGCGNSSYTIAVDSGYLTASNEDTVVTYQSEKSELSEWRFLTREQFIEEAVAKAADDNPADVTSLILDSGFGRYNSYINKWSGGPVKGGDNNNFCAERYHVAFDSQQILENVPNGVYEMTVQGFYRADSDSVSPTLYYINEVEKQLKTVESEGKTQAEGGWSTKRGEVYVPNSMADSSKCFTAGAYTNESITVTVTDHTLKVGVKTTDTNSWVIWDNFTLKLKDSAAYNVRQAIDEIGEISLDPACKAQIDAVRAAYDALTDGQKAMVTNYSDLEAAEAEYDRLFQEGGQQALDQAAANAAAAKITAIGTVELTEACKAKIDEARAVYDALTEAQKALITAEQLKVLTDAEAAYQNLKTAADQAQAAVVVGKITAIGEVAFTLESRLAIEEARAAYDALTEEQKAFVTTEQLAVLTTAEAKYAELVAAGAILADGDYYILNAATGKYLNAGNSYQTQATAKNYGQLMTITVNEGDNTAYTVDSHYTKGGKHYLGANGYLDASAAPIKIEKCANGSFCITNADGSFLTAPTEGSVIEFKAEKLAESEWLILTRRQLVEKLSKEVTEENPADITSLIFDPGFDRYNDYFNKWSGDIVKGGADGNNNVELYKKLFNSMQTIENIPNGVYELSVQGFYRKETGTAAPAVYYINETEAELKTIEADGKPQKIEGSWTTQKGDVFVPNSMAESSNCFNEGAYINDFITVRVTDHTLKIGVKTTDAENWVIWDNFTLRLKEVASDAEEAAYAVEKINAIGTVSLTDECDAKIKAAREAYEALTETQKALVTAEQLKVLTDAEAQYNNLRAAASVIELIGDIGEVSLHITCKEKIEAARAAYAALTEAQKAFVTNYEVLEAAEAEYERLLEEGGQAAIDQLAAENAIEKINAIGTVEATAACKEKIDEARAVYDALTEAQKALVTAEQLKVLTDAEEEFAVLNAVANVIELIDSIGEVSLKPACKEKIDEARAAYDALTDEQKASVTNYEVLETAEAEYERLLEEGGQEAVDQAAAADAVEKINAIGTVEATAACKERIETARAAYEALTEAQKALVTEEQLQVLTDAEAEYEELAKDLLPSTELKEQLAAAIEAELAEALVEEAYTEETWLIYKEALETLQALAENEDATRQEIEEALEDMKTAGEGLEVKEEYKPTQEQITALESAVTSAADINPADYKEDENWTAFQTALARAQSIKNRPNATQAQVEKAMTDLAETISKLTPATEKTAADKTALNKAISDCGALKQSDYTANTWSAFLTALNTAKAVAAKEDATQEEVNNALAALNAKKAALQKIQVQPTVRVNKITLSAESKNIAAGKKVTVKAVVKPDNAANKGLIWKSSNNKWATVNNKGVVTTKKAGAGKTVTITATAADGSNVKGTIKIKIMKNAVTKITLKAKSKKVKAGKKVTVKATVKTNGSKANKKLVWKTSNKKWATVNSKGVVTTKKAGKGKTVTITATSTDGTKKSAKVKIKIVK